MNKDREYMAIALDEARLAMESGEVPVGAVLIDDEGGVVVRAHNLCESERDATAHAEIQAIREAGRRLSRWRLNGCTLYVTLEPCSMCAGAIMAARISRLVYGATDARTGAVESIFNIPGHPSLAPSPEITAGVMEDECKDLLQKFFAERR
ncbi:MAG: tRNA adenosine(34) deaminase TadA [Schwartzia sp.]|nr:tRNA adenosine(34) deaminase TadA [Schwartzia sp. (in: firmicutes)]